MKPIALSALAGVLLILGVVPASQAVEILRWERLPLPVPLVVGQERVVFIDRHVRVGVPASVGDRLPVQRAGGARNSVVSGESVSVRVDFGGLRYVKKKKK